ncbi:MAG: hypothetical protein NTX55_00420 [Candidatus Parcubacteria bacterium]|nr:hypothetical protein [Candidatus Parcubacteria bacterium]
MIKRIVCDIGLFLGIFFLPWWGTAILVFVFMILFKKFWEGVAAMLFIDSLSSLPGTSASWRIYGHFGIFVVPAIILLLIIENLKTKIRFKI